MSWSLPETGGQNYSTPFSLYNVLGLHIQVSGPGMQLWYVVLQTFTSYFWKCQFPCCWSLCGLQWDAKILGVGCGPPPVGGSLLAASQRAMWISCSLVTLPTSKECKDCSCCQRVESIGLCWETNAVWVNRVTGSLRIPLPCNSICVCHCPAFLLVTLTFPG